MQLEAEIKDFIADVKEQMLYLQELGVAEMDINLIEPIAAQKKAASPAAAERFIPDEPTRRSVQTNRQLGKVSGISRLAKLPSLSRQNTKADEARFGADNAPDPETPDTPPIPETPVIPEIPTIPEEPKIPETPAIPDDPQTPVIPEIPVVPETRTSTAMLFGNIAPTLQDTEDTIESIRAEIGDCKRCDLCNLGRTQIVHSTGNFNADLMFVGEAPGADEDEQGFPFVGRAGQLLTKIIEGIGLKREDVFIGNINRCRPPGNRQPLPPETAACRPFLLREIAVVRPKVIVVLGNTATQNLLNIKTPISKLRGNFQNYFGVKVMPTFHPAYLLRDPHKKREVWEDMKKVRDYLSSL